MRHGISDTVLKYLLREFLIHMALLTHQVDKVHVCPPLTSLSCLTYIFPSYSPTTLALFFTARPDPFGLLVSSFWALHQVFLRFLFLPLFFKNKVISMFTMALNATHSHNASIHGFQGCSSKQCPCQS